MNGTHKQTKEETKKATWPALDKDQRAWELAKVALGPDADLHALVSRAQQIKENL